MSVDAERFVKTRLTWILGIVCMLFVLLTRTWGLHVDEIRYFHVAIREPLGDALESGKPFVFYVLNYALYHVFRWPAGWLHPLILPVFYAVATVLALWFLAARAVDAGAHRAWAVAVLLLSPFVLFNASQLMMETAQLPLLSVTLALLLSVSAGRHTSQHILWLVAAAAGSVLIKETALPALLILILAFFPVLGLRVWPLIAGAAIGSTANALLLRAIHAPLPPTHYGGMAQLWTSLTAGQPWARTSSYLGVWGFFVGLAWLGALAVAVRRRDPMSWTLVAAGALSAGGVFLVQLATDPILPFPRYAYPVMWAGLACCGIACARTRTGWVSAAVVVLQLPIAGGLWPGTFSIIEHWPTLITLESYNNSATILSGTPAYGWIATSPRALDDLCVYLPRGNAAGAAHTEMWFRDVARQVRFFDERSYPAFQGCNAARAIVDRRFDVNACQEDVCSPSRYSIRSCLERDVLYFSARIGPTKSRVCLP
ncbi:MAG TPA: hypothetical protein VFC01_18095 [Mycobacterium sp.]|nr:hypothetical protein [Mycobacterium sp.]